MPETRIMIVEDERIVAEDLKISLEDMGYKVSAIVSTGEDAVKKAGEVMPDLILMDIVLKGVMDGIRAAEEIHRKFYIPFIYITAYADEKTIARAKITSPFGYIVKPFEDRELHSTIEIALYKHAMEKKLRESEEKYRTYVENFQGIAFYARMDFVPIYFQGLVEKITGYTEEEFIRGKPRWDQVIHPDDLAGLQESFEKVHSLPGYSADREYRIIRKDGQIRWVHEAIKNVTDGTPENTYVRGAIFDITARKKAEEELLKAAKEWRITFDSITDFVSVIDNDHKFIKVNQALAGFLGKKPEDLIGKKCYKVFHGTGEPPEDCPHMETFRTRKPVTKEIYDETRDMYLLTAVSPVIDEKGDMKGIVHFARDITGRKRLEKEIKNRMEELEKFYDMAVGRELKMKKLKQEIERLKEKLAETYE